MFDRLSRVMAAIGWDVGFEVRHRGRTHRASRLSPSELTFVAAAQLDPNWLTEIDIECVRIMVNVTSCEPVDDGYEVTVRPYALGGDAKTTWLKLIGSTRPNEL